MYDGKDLGVTCTEEGTSFLLWSPAADSVTLNLYRSGDEGEAFERIPMRQRQQGVWEWRVEEELHGIYYDFTLKMDGETIRSADPYAKACGLNGRRSMAVNL